MKKGCTNSRRAISSFCLAFLLVAGLPADCYVAQSYVAATGPRKNKAAFIAVQVQSTKSPETDTKEETLSDVDARVLKSMLSENKLDLETEGDVRKLLQRGTVKTVNRKTGEAKQDDDESEFSSQILKTLADTKLWKKVSAQASDAFESVGIFIANKVEQDVKVLAALGLFAWDRAVRDVARALPAAGSQAKQILILTNSSSFQQLQELQQTDGKSVKDKLARPQDEIKSVSREVLDILKGERTTSAGQGLRTVAPAGSVNAAERQRRAYQQRQKVDRQKKDVTKMGGSVVDSAWELRRELKAESNVPGYKSEPARKAIAAGVRNTGNMLQAAKEQARLAAAKRKELRLVQATEQAAEQIKEAQTDNVPEMDAKSEQSRMESFDAMAKFQEELSQIKSVEVDSAASTVKGEANKQAVSSAVEDSSVDERKQESVRVDRQQKGLIDEVKAERARLMVRLQLCVESPSTTWLTSSVVDSLSLKGKDIFDGPAIEDAIAKMILLKEELGDFTKEEIDSSVEMELGQLSNARDSVDDLCSFMASSLAEVVANQFRVEVYQPQQEPLILRLEEVAESLVSKEQAQRPATEAFFVEAKGTTFSVVDGKAIPQKVVNSVPDAVIEVIPDVVVTEMESDNDAIMEHDTIATVFVDGADAAGVGLVAEIVTDEDFDNAVGAAKVAVEVTAEGEEDEEKEDNLLVQLTLRSLDVVFFVVEKVVIVGIPGTTVVVKTAMVRLEEVKRDGRGSEGWQQFDNLATTKGKY